jgi:hypothetical protein
MRTRICVETATSDLVFDQQGRRLAIFDRLAQVAGWIDEERLVVHRPFSQGSVVVPDSPARLIVVDQRGAELGDLPLPQDALDGAMNFSVAHVSPDGSRILFSTPTTSSETGPLLHHVLDTADGSVIARTEGLSMLAWVDQRDLVSFESRLSWYDDKLVVRHDRAVPFSGLINGPWQRHEVVISRFRAGSAFSDGLFRVSLDNDAPPSPLPAGAFAISPDLARTALVTGETKLALGRPDGSDAQALLDLPRQPIYLAW